MEYIYSAMLLHSAGQKITEVSVKKVLEGAGLKPDEARIKALVSALEGVNIDEVISQAAVATVVAQPQAPQKVEEKVEEKKEEEKVEEKAEQAAEGLASLFG